MPRTIREILEHAEEIAQRFEDFDPEQGIEIPVEEHLLQRAVIARAASERQVIDAVTRARAAGVPWSRIGVLLGTSAQAARKRYAPVVEASS